MLLMFYVFSQSTVHRLTLFRPLLNLISLIMSSLLVQASNLLLQLPYGVLPPYQELYAPP